jgi:hypothetical protein
MKYIVIVSYDMSPPDPAKYPSVNAELEKLGLRKFVFSIKKNKDVKLPHNIFVLVRNFKGLSTAEVRTHLRDRIKAAFKKCRFRRRIFIGVGDKWARAVSVV